jgi:DNA-binding response OmpR family regulator
MFAVTVPRALRSSDAGQAALPATGAAAAPASLAGVRILLADDEPLALDAMGRALADAGAEITRASSADEVRKLAKRAFDVYVLDLNLGRENGADLLDELGRRSGGSIPGLVVTGATTQEVLSDLRARGRPWLTKPVAAVALTHAIGALLAQPA